MGYVAPIIAGAGQVMEGIGANEAAKSQSNLIGKQTRNDVREMKTAYKNERGSQIAQAGASGVELTSGSFGNVFANNAVNMAKSVADRRYAGAVAQAQAEQAGKNALIGGIVSGIATGIGGIQGANFRKQMLDKQGSSLLSTLDIMTPKE